MTCTRIILAQTCFNAEVANIKHNKVKIMAPKLRKKQKAISKSYSENSIPQDKEVVSAANPSVDISEFDGIFDEMSRKMGNVDLLSYFFLACISAFSLQLQVIRDIKEDFNVKLQEKENKISDLASQLDEALQKIQSVNFYF